MIARVKPGRLQGHINAVTSKSCAHRMLIAAALADRPTTLTIDAANQDIEATAACLTALGAQVERCGNQWRVSPVKPAQKATLDCGESGSTLRFLMPVAATLGVDATFTGHGRLPERPHTPLCDALRQHGVVVESDSLPMRMCGVPTSGVYALPGNISSQYISALMFALPLLTGDSTITLTEPLESESYVRLTMNALRQFGVTVHETDGGYAIPGGQTYKSPGSAVVEGDWSAAAFFLAANHTGSQVVIDGLDPESAQGDRAMLSVMEQLRGVDRTIDATDIPDLVPAIAAAAALTPGRTEIIGASRLRYKECDRLMAMRQGLHAMGCAIFETPDGLDIIGGALRGARVSGFNDHRIVMALAIAALGAVSDTEITDAQAVAKSYPGFWNDFTTLGGDGIVQLCGD